MRGRRNIRRTRGPVLRTAFLERHLRQLNRYPEPLKTGHLVIIPTLRRVSVRKAQSLESFAKTHLQDEERAPYLRALNGLKVPKLKKGKRLLVPSSSLKHLVRPGETLESIANRYYRATSRRRLRLLRLYNKLPKGRLSAKTELRIPLDTRTFLDDRVRARAAKPPEPTPVLASAPRLVPAKERPTVKKSRTRRVTKPTPITAESIRAVETAIEQAERHLSNGRYEAALTTAERTLTTYDQTRVTQKVELLRIKATAWVALAKPKRAKTAFEALLRLDPAYRLDLYSTSPKVLDVFQSISARWD